MSYQLLGFRLVVNTNCGMIEKHMADIAVRAEQAFPCWGDIPFKVTKNREGYIVNPPNGDVVLFSNPQDAVKHVYGFINFIIRSRMPGKLFIHGGCASYNEKTFLVVGEKWAGKTTLLCKLLLEGFDVHGDESVILEETHVIPFPRRFFLKEESLLQLPELKELCLSSTRYVFDDKKGYFIDPLGLGKTWSLAPKTPDSIIYLVPSHGEASKKEQIPGWQITEKIFKQADNFSNDAAQQLKDLSRLVNEARCYVLHSGNLEQAVQIIKESLS